MSTRETAPKRLRAVLIAATAAAMLASALGTGTASASKSQWSVFEDHTRLVRLGPGVRQATLDEIKALGADTLRLEVKWAEVAPSPGSRKRPSFDATNPGAYLGFEPYDDIVRRATGMGYRLIVTLAPDAPRWATARGRGGNYKVSAGQFGAFARAVGRRYSGAFGGLPAVRYWSIWNEPNHVLFLKPRSQAPRVYRGLVAAGLPALRATVPAGSRIFVGELAPVGTATKTIGPLKFLRTWLCLDNRYKRLRGRAAKRAGCKRFRKVAANGFAHHPYGPVGAAFWNKDIVNIQGIRRLAAALDRAGRAGRIKRGLPIYNTEFGYQTNPPDPFTSTSPTRQAEILNDKEEFSYRYSRLKSYSQYLLFDDPARSGPAALRWSGFQTGLHFSNGTLKPAWNAYRYPIVVRKRGRGVYVWGRVRPGTGTRHVQLQRRSGGGYVNDGSAIATNSAGYFKVKRRRGTYRFQALAGRGGPVIGTSRAAKPLR